MITPIFWALSQHTSTRPQGLTTNDLNRIYSIIGNNQIRKQNEVLYQQNINILNRAIYLDSLLIAQKDTIIVTLKQVVVLERDKNQILQDQVNTAKKEKVFYGLGAIGIILTFILIR
jgi:lipopolysaccharide assembly outer membrane protein LptD (OstA)